LYSAPSSASPSSAATPPFSSCPARLVQSGRRRDHPLLHGHLRFSDHLPPQARRRLRRAAPRRSRHRPRQQQRAPLPPPGLPSLARLHIRSRPQVCRPGHPPHLRIEADGGIFRSGSDRPASSDLPLLLIDRTPSLLVLPLAVGLSRLPPEHQYTAAIRQDQFFFLTDTAAPVTLLHPRGRSPRL
ncbi:hypothetical protein MUK42_15178, partial [Musa troglodytarum]